MADSLIIYVISSIPIHLLFNSAIFQTDYRESDFSLTIATEDLSQTNRRATTLETQGMEPATDKPRMDVLDVNTSNTSRGHNTSITSIYQNTSTTSIYQNTSNTSQHLGGRKDIYINHNIPYVSSHSFSSLAINLRLQLQPHRTVVRGLHASLTNRLL